MDVDDLNLRLVEGWHEVLVRKVVRASLPRTAPFRGWPFVHIYMDVLRSTSAAMHGESVSAIYFCDRVSEYALLAFCEAVDMPDIREFVRGAVRCMYENRECVRQEIPCGEIVRVITEKRVPRSAGIRASLHTTWHKVK